MTEEKVDQDRQTKTFAEGFNEVAAADLVFFGDPKYAYSKSINAVVNVATRKPVDEPVFLLRAQDINSAKAINEYAMSCTNGEHRAAVFNRYGEFARWQRKHPERMKEPD